MALESGGEAEKTLCLSVWPGTVFSSSKKVPDANLCFRFDIAGETMVDVGAPKQGRWEEGSWAGLRTIESKELSVLQIFT